LNAEPIAYIGLGANLANAGAGPAQTLAHAIDAIGRLPRTRVDAASVLYLSDPVDAEGPVYFNQVVRLATGLPALTLLDRLQSIEREFGRERPHHNAPRTLDLDLLLFDEQIIVTSRLTVPHPRLHERLFVLLPLADLDPGLIIPGRGRLSEHLRTVQAHQAQRCVPAA